MDAPVFPGSGRFSPVRPVSPGSVGYGFPPVKAANVGSTLIVTTNWFDDLRKRAPVSQ